MRGFSRQERGELFHSFSFPGPDFPSHLDFPSPIVPPPPHPDSAHGSNTGSQYYQRVAAFLDS